MNPVKERRESKDIWSFVLVFLNIFSWIFLLILLLIFHHAQPEFETFFDRFYQLKIRTFWQIKYTYLLIYFVMTGLTISAVGMMISHYRARRKNDHWCSLIIMASVSIILMVIALLHL